MPYSGQYDHTLSRYSLASGKNANTWNIVSVLWKVIFLLARCVVAVVSTMSEKVGPIRWKLHCAFQNKVIPYYYVNCFYQSPCDMQTYGSTAPLEQCNSLTGIWTVEHGKLEGLCMGLPKSHDTVCTSNKQITKTLTGEYTISRRRLAPTGGEGNPEPPSSLATESPPSESSTSLTPSSATFKGTHPFTLWTRTCIKLCGVETVLN